MSLPHTDPLSARTPPTPETQVAIDDAEERAARAAYEASYDRPAAIKWDELTEYTKTQWRRIARAAIRAICEGGHQIETIRVRHQGGEHAEYRMLDVVEEAA